MFCGECGSVLQMNNKCLNPSCKNYLGLPKNLEKQYCYYCGKSMHITADKCPKCGKKVKNSVDAVFADERKPFMPQDNKWTNVSSTVLDARTVFESVKKKPLIFDIEPISINTSTQIDSLVSDFLNLNTVSAVLNHSSIKQCEMNIAQKRQRNPVASEYNARMDQNIMFEYYQYSYLLNVFDVLKGKRTDQVRVSYEALFELIFNDCKTRVMNLEQEKTKSKGLERTLFSYSVNNSRYKMPNLGTVNQRENDYIIATMMNWSLQCIMEYIFSSGLGKTLNVLNNYSSQNVKMAVDSFITSMCSVRLSIYGGDVSGSYPKNSSQTNDDPFQAVVDYVAMMEKKDPNFRNSVKEMEPSFTENLEDKNRPDFEVQRDIIKYLEDLSGDSFRLIINNEYNLTKGSFEECKAFYNIDVSVKFALLLFLRRTVKMVLHRNLDKYGSFILNSAEITAFAFMGMPGNELADNITNLIMQYEEIIPYSDWDDALWIIEKKFKNSMLELEFCYKESNLKSINDIVSTQEYYKKTFCPAYNSKLKSMKTAIDYYRKKGLCFDEITFNITD